MNVKLQKAIKELQRGKMVLLVDDKDRENEGDLILAADFVSADKINFMIAEGRGILCLSMTTAHSKRLGIPLMTRNNSSAQSTPFGVSIEAARGVTTGVSAADRALTIATACNGQSTSSDIVMPGHVFPLIANQHGSLGRAGHTEGSVDLMKLADLSEMAVICEVMNSDGTMARANELESFSNKHDIPIISMQDIIDYRWTTESLVSEVAMTSLPTLSYGHFDLKVFRNDVDSSEHVVLFKSFSPTTVPLVRIHSECLTGDVFSSLRCDCGQQLQHAMQQLDAQGGVLVYLRQEGRGIGLVNKIKAYALQERGVDTVEANYQLGFSADCREYYTAAQILKALGIARVNLITNNPDKVCGIERYGVIVKKRVPIEIQPSKENLSYLQTKRDKLGHHLHFKELSCQHVE